MNTIKWILLCVVFTAYLLIGGSIIMVLEQGNEINQNQELGVLRKDIQEILFRLDREFYLNGTTPDIVEAVTSAKESVLNRISDICGGKNLLSDENIENKPLTWTFYNSVFFAFTAVTTIGYGNLTPQVPISRMFTILYALFGIPINGIIISGLSDYYSKKLIKAHKRSKDKRSSFDARVIFIFDIIFYLIPGILVFIVAPAGFFVIIEKWSFVDSIYFSFVTLSTIGFGDYVAGMGDGHNVLLWLYKIVIIVWIMFGLGYLLMILSFITKGMTSKQVRTVIERRLDGIKSTKEKLSKDIDYMRRVVQELYLIKGKPGFSNQAEVEAELTSSTPANFKYSPDIRRNVSFDVNNYGKQRPQPIAFARCRSESALDDLSKQSDAINNNIDPWTLSDQLMANLVSVITGNMNEMIHAVEELNDYENDLHLTQIEGGDVEDVDLEIVVEHSKGDILDARRLEEYDSDEEILIEEDEDALSINDNDKLERVVVQPNLPEHKPETFMEKLGEAFRKISTGKRSDGPSRKISRNEPEPRQHPPDESRHMRRTSPARHTTPSRRHSKDGIHDSGMSRRNSRHLSRAEHFHAFSHAPINHSAMHNDGLQKISSSKSMSRANSNNSLHGDGSHHLDSQAYPHYRRQFNAHNNQLDHGHGHRSGRVSAEHGIDEQARFAMERKSLQELLNTLDAVQDRLHHTELTERPHYGSSADHSEEHRGQRRRRKVGIFNPGFSFLETAFGKDNHQKPHGT